MEVTGIIELAILGESSSANVVFYIHTHYRWVFPKIKIPQNGW